MIGIIKLLLIIFGFLIGLAMFLENKIKIVKIKKGMLSIDLDEKSN